MTIPIIGQNPGVIADESARLILQPTLERMLETLGAPITARHLAQAFAGVVSAGGPVVAAQLLHSIHLWTEDALRARAQAAVDALPQNPS